MHFYDTVLITSKAKGAYINVHNILEQLGYHTAVLPAALLAHSVVV